MNVKVVPKKPIWRIKQKAKQNLFYNCIEEREKLREVEKARV